MQLIIYSEKITPRVGYAFKLFFGTILGITYKITEDKDEYKNSLLPKINYSKNPITEEILIEPHPLLFKITLEEINPLISDFSGTKIFFTTSNKSALPFDIFAAGFYLVTRYEEYKAVSHDSHNRFKVTDSLAYKNYFLEEPIVNIWALLLKDILTKKYSQIIFPVIKYKFLPTIDIDNAWAFLNKSFLRGAAASAKAILRLDSTILADRLKVVIKREKDPYDTYDYIKKKHLDYKLQPVLFFLLGKYNRYDKNIAPDNKNLHQLIQQMNALYPIGIHPSYNSNTKIDILKQEVQTLAAITKNEVTKSRQHFLKLSFPTTYKNLVALGIKEDYTMGYAQLPGFRAGICTPYPFFDLVDNTEIPLMIFPFQVMDTTFREYLDYTPKQATEEIEGIVNAVKKVNGTFISIWHNESLSEKWKWEGWRIVYEKLLEFAR